MSSNETCKLFKGGRRKANKARCQSRHKKKMRQESKKTLQLELYMTLLPLLNYN